MTGGGFILVICPETKRMLLGLRNDDTPWHPNTWFPFGGTMEDDEKPIETAVREFREETTITPDNYNIRPEPLYYVQEQDGDITYNQHVFIASTDTEFTPTIDEESKDWQWVHIDQIPKINSHPMLLKIFSNNNSIKQIKAVLLSKIH